ncbi:MAG: DUF362 domain-containing protein [Candidatus Helarchaeota archaeon]|nr:DUF362 domain-containing protein [Candidatus Helarchaeota archaeon]
MALVRGNDPYETTMEALQLIADDIRTPKSPVIIKPNLLTVKKIPLVVTNPRVCAAVADFLKEKKSAKTIKLGDGTTHGKNPDTLRSMKNNGYIPYQNRWTPVSFINEPPGKWFPIYSLGYSGQLEIGIAKSIWECPFIVSTPKFKTHDVLGLTLSLKNFMGTLTTVRDAETKQIIARETTNVCGYMHGFGDKKPDKLSDDENTGPSKLSLAINLNRLAKSIPPSLAVVDGIEAMEGDGPVHGTRKNLGLIIASTDFIAADTVATHIAEIDPLHIQYIHQAGLMGLGEFRLDHIKILGESLDSAISPFRPHHLYSRSKFTEEQIFSLRNNLPKNHTQ